MYRLETKHRIYGCHKLKDQGGKCTKWHGHQYEVILSFEAETLDYRNMIMDTYDIAAEFLDFIDDDHLNLNEFMNSENPTMEEMSMFFYTNLKEKFPCLVSVTVYENTDASCTYYGD
ncbi:MAG: 6-carboxytetrahydropterin synthase [archaeon]|nr:6-carboxytetrahydropterin synthase [archaeon]